jgi:hypothetical protein
MQPSTNDAPLSPHQHTPFESLVNPIATGRPGQTGLRDPALFEHKGVIHLFCSASWWDGERLVSTVEHRKSIDLQSWTEPRMIGVPTLCSPGNVLQVGDCFVLCCQSFPKTLPSWRQPKGVTRHDCRLWLLWSDDLTHWSDPRIVMPGGCDESWSADSRRQIDPCLIEYDGRYWMLCKQGNPGTSRLGLLVSKDLEHWETVKRDQPVLGPHNVPSGGGLENPMIIKDGDEFVCFFQCCGGNCSAMSVRSRNLLDWYSPQKLDLPYRPWMHNHHGAPCVIDTRHLNGKWLMAFHSDAMGPVAMSGRIGLAWSDDLVKWEMS